MKQRRNIPLLFGSLFFRELLQAIYEFNDRGWFVGVKYGGRDEKQSDMREYRVGNVG
jgi:hypothetical protein